MEAYNLQRPHSASKTGPSADGANGGYLFGGLLTVSMILRQMLSKASAPMKSMVPCSHADLRRCSCICTVAAGDGSPSLI